MIYSITVFILWVLYVSALLLVKLIRWSFILVNKIVILLLTPSVKASVKLNEVDERMSERAKTCFK